ncbi:Crp/Fnr family transcriptional regulator [Agaribacterium haliotis]|uniref:Crp/Fnr family transcriptional regulator n=1 Tax=Agaribacterium haliotis TaxID=2013869 RepID=UPI001304460C|nr:Crp/Fnr family transcriptional regulator [Agaribacterium haliotis]
MSGPELEPSLNPHLSPDPTIKAYTGAQGGYVRSGQDGFASLVAYLNSLACFSDAEVGQLCTLFKLKPVKKSETLLGAGERWDTIYFVKQGLLRLYYLSPDGKEFNKGFFADNNLVWPISSTAQRQLSKFSIASLEPCELMAAPFSVFQKAVEKTGKWLEFSAPFTGALLDLKIRREEQFLLNDAQSRYRQVHSEMRSFIDRIPDYHIASYLGITHIAFSRMKRSMKLT